MNPIRTFIYILFYAFQIFFVLTGLYFAQFWRRNKKMNSTYVTFTSNNPFLCREVLTLLGIETEEALSR